MVTGGVKTHGITDDWSITGDCAAGGENGIDGNVAAHCRTGAAGEEQTLLPESRRWNEPRLLLSSSKAVASEELVVVVSAVKPAESERTVIVDMLMFDGPAMEKPSPMGSVSLEAMGCV